MSATADLVAFVRLGQIAARTQESDGNRPRCHAFWSHRRVLSCVLVTSSRGVRRRALVPALVRYGEDPRKAASSRPRPLSLQNRPRHPTRAAGGTSDRRVRHHAARMRAVTFQAPGEVRVDERPDPELTSRDDAIVRIEASGICGSDLHIYHGRVKIEPGFTIGHEFVGTVLAAGDDVTRVTVRRPGARLLPLRLRHVLLLPARHLPQVRPHAGLRPRRTPRRSPGHAGRARARADGEHDAAAGPRGRLRRGRAVRRRRDGHRLPRGRRGDIAPGDSVAVLGLGPVGLCAVQVALAAGAVPGVRDRLRAAAARDRRERSARRPVHLTEEKPRDVVRAAHRRARRRRRDRRRRAPRRASTSRSALPARPERSSRSACTPSRAQVHMGLIWIKALTLKSGHANVIGHVDRVLGDAPGRVRSTRRRSSRTTCRSTTPPRRTRSMTAVKR